MSPFLSDVRHLDREDFFRLNHEWAFRPQDEVAFDENAAERIWGNDDPMSSIDLELEQDASSQNGQSSQHEDRISVDEHGNVSQHSQNRQSTNSTQGFISIAESSMSTDSLTHGRLLFHQTSEIMFDAIVSTWH